MPKGKPKSWRDVLPIHPAADLFPLMSPDELRALGEDIKKNGLQHPPVLWADDENGAPYKLIDGRNRLDAMEAAGILHVDGETEHLLATSPRGQQHWLTLEHLDSRVDPDPYTYVISANVHRRHLTTEQKRDLIAKVIKATPEKSNRSIAQATKSDHKTVAAVRAEKEATGEIPQLSKTVGKDGKARTTAPTKKATQPVDHGRHKCWQCEKWGRLGEVERHEFEPYYDADADVWLHPACVAAFSSSLTKREPAARDDIGAESTGELDRLHARIAELEAEVRRLTLELEAARRQAAPVVDGIPEFLDRRVPR
jgi:ParB/Sulfiredoxin domain